MAATLYEQIAALERPIRPGFARPINPTKCLMGIETVAPTPAVVNQSAMSAKAIISTIAQDRDGDELTPQGCLPTLENYRRNPVVFFSHQLFPLPIAKSRNPATGQLAVQVYANDRVEAECWFSQKSQNALDVFVLIGEGILNMTSVGFVPIKAERIESKGGADRGNAGRLPGFRISQWDLLEWSWVGVPSNPYAEAVRSYLSRGYITGKGLTPELRQALEPLAAKEKVWAPGATLPAPTQADPIRWNKSLGTHFDVEAQDPGPSTMKYDWAAKHIGCKVKDIFQNSEMIPAPRMGTYLMALRNVLAPHPVHDVRNIDGNKECPPVYDVIQLNSSQRDDFLTEGTCFHVGDKRFVMDYSANWGGFRVTCYASLQHKDFSRGIFDQARAWAEANNFLRGEAFALSGEFLKRTGEGWDDVFLEAKNKTVLSRVIDQLNQRGKGFANRGVILTGPPGTGKTLSGRIIRNQANATFIWISSRDFHYSGSFGGISLGFEMARELAPAVLFLEDVDNWLTPNTIDLLKTEMDGIARSTGVLTILTTNFPESLPEALIDRPGRFHDVLLFGLPDDKSKLAMLGKWLPTLSGPMAATVISQTTGFSGAHMYELAAFAKTLMDTDDLDATTAIQRALAKIEEQRDLITNLQLQGSHYQPRLRPKQFKRAKCGGEGGTPGPCPEGGGSGGGGQAGGSSDKPAGTGGGKGKPLADTRAKVEAVKNLVKTEVIPRGAKLLKKTGEKGKKIAASAIQLAKEKAAALKAGLPEAMHSLASAPVDSWIFSTALTAFQPFSGFQVATQVGVYAATATIMKLRDKLGKEHKAMDLSDEQIADLVERNRAAIQELAAGLNLGEKVALPTEQEIEKIIRGHMAEEKQMSKKWKKTKAAAKPKEAPAPVQDQDARGTDVQALICSRAQYPDQAAAVTWATDQGFKVDALEETEAAWVFTQFPEGELQPDSRHEEQLADGVTAVMGQRQVEPERTGNEPGEPAKGKGSSICNGIDYKGKIAGMEDPGAELNTADLDVGPTMPLGAELLQAIIELISGRMPSLEVEVSELFQGLLDEALAIADERYPDLGLGVEDDEPEPDQPEPTADTGEVVEEEYRSFILARLKGVQLKGRLSKKACGIIKGAADHLDEAGEHDGVPSMMRAAHKHHGKNLGSLLEKVADMIEEEPKPETKPAADEVPEQDKAVLMQAVAELKQQLFRLTGKA